MSKKESYFDKETQAHLPSLFGHLPEPVKFVVWAYEEGNPYEVEAIKLCQALAGQFEMLSFTSRPRRDNYPHYPVIGIMGDTGEAESWQDFGVRLIGLPSGYQMTSLVTAVQAVSFRGMTLEAKTRIQLKRLQDPVKIEVITADDNEGGAIMSTPAFNMAVVSPAIRTYLIMANQFPEITNRYSIDVVPHTVINGRVHISGAIDEDHLLRQIAIATKKAPLS